MTTTATAPPASTTATRRPASPRRRVFMMDLLATVPYYTAYLSQALLREGADIQVGSITYYLDPDCFSSRRLQNRPGLLNLVGRFALPPLPRKTLKLAELLLNLLALTLRFLVLPPEVVHVQYLPVVTSPLPLDLWFLRFCRWRRASVVLTCHDLLPHNSAQRFRGIYEQVYRFADGIICHSDSIRDRLVREFGVPANRISVVPHGPFFYDLPAATDPAPVLQSFHVEPEGAPFVLWQGIVSPYKGVDLLLEAWAAVEASHPSARLVVAGTGAPALLAELRARAETLGLKRVCLHQDFISSEQLVALYRAASVVVYPYRDITTSGALATGLSFAKPIVASDLPVFRELLTDGQNARLVDREPAPLASALLALLNDPAQRERFSQKLRAMAFGDAAWQHIAARTVDAYERSIDRADLAAARHEDPRPTVATGPATRPNDDRIAILTPPTL